MTSFRPNYLFVGRNEDTLGLKELSKLTILVHGHQDITATDELLLEVELRNGGPFGVLLHTYNTISNLNPPVSDIDFLPERSSASSRTLKATNFLGSTPCRPRIWMLARENPHCGVSGVPFMNRTTGAEETALSMAVRVSSEIRRAWRAEGMEGPVGN